MIKKKKLSNVIFRLKPTQMLLNLFNKNDHVNYASALAKEIDCTYSHVVKVLQEFEKDGLLIFNKSGRIKELKLTKKGIEVCENIDRTINLL